MRALPAVATLAVLVLPTCACTSDPGRGRPTVLTSAQTPRPERSAPATKTLDSTGYVDNGGRTSDQTGRSQTSGMRATEAGGERAGAGAPGSGTPLPGLDPAPGPGQSRPAPLATRDTPGVGSAPDEQVARFARARCDWEVACGRVGADKPHASAESCTNDVKPLVRKELAQIACAQGLDSQNVGLCINAIRTASCSGANDVFVSGRDCKPSVVCAM